MKSQATLFSSENYIKLQFFRENVTLEREEVAEGWQKASDLDAKKKSNILLLTGKYSLLDKEARAFVVAELSTWPYVAIVIDNTGQRIMGRVILNLTGRGGQIKLFENEMLALKWLMDLNSVKK